MTTIQFGVLLRRLTRALSRRRILSAFTVILAPRLALPEHALACKNVGRKCDKNKDCCDGSRCKGGKRGKCRCKSGFTDCSGVKGCKSLQNDSKHCGACNTVCDGSERCCSGVCVDLQTSNDHCGACGNACLEDEGCVEGVCFSP